MDIQVEGFVITQIEASTAKTPARWRVILDGYEIGLLEKYRNTRTETHPWKALGQVDEDCGVRVRPLVHVSYKCREEAIEDCVMKLEEIHYAEEAYYAEQVKQDRRDEQDQARRPF